MKIEQYGHGGDRLTAAEVFNRKEEEFLDFSANINPLGPPSRVLARIQDAISSIVHYPDPAHRSFTHGLADKLQVDESCLLVGNGAAECMALVLLAFQPQKVGVIDPCFSEYRSLAEQFGAQVEGIQGLPSQGFIPDLQQVHPLFSICDLIFVGNPNNPTGMMYTLENLQTMARWAEETNTWLVIDEAFIDFVPEAEQPTMLHSLDVYRKVILIRSMTKFYAIPGLRLGFAAAHSEAIRRMKGVQVTWSVNSLALVAGEACLEETDYEQKTRELISIERYYLFSSIREKLGWKVWPSTANFLLVRLPNSLTAEELQLRLGLRGILIRNCSMYPGLTPHDFRIAIKNREDNDKLLHALIQLVNERRQGGAK